MARLVLSLPDADRNWLDALREATGMPCNFHVIRAFRVLYGRVPAYSTKINNTLSAVYVLRDGHYARLSTCAHLEASERVANILQDRAHRMTGCQ